MPGLSSADDQCFRLSVGNTGSFGAKIVTVFWKERRGRRDGSGRKNEEAKSFQVRATHVPSRILKNDHRLSCATGNRRGT